MLASVQELCDDRVLGTKQHSSNETEGKSCASIKNSQIFHRNSKSDGTHSFLEEEVVYQRTGKSRATATLLEKTTMCHVRVSVNFELFTSRR
jgi:hypothetical protein